MKDSSPHSDEQETKDAFLGLFLKPSLKEAARATAKREGISLSEVARRSLRREVESERRMQAA